MLEFTSAGTPIVLAPGTSVQLEYNSPLFDEEALKGNFSYALGVPAEDNGPVYGFPELPANAQAAPSQLPAELSQDGYTLLRGVQNVTGVNTRRYTVGVIGGLNALAAAMDGRKLHEFQYGGKREVPLYEETSPGFFRPGIIGHANATVQNPEAFDYVFAPLHNPGFFDTTLPDPNCFVNPWVYSDIDFLGQPAGGTFIYRIPFSVPGGSQALPDQPPMCAFPYVHYVLTSIFRELGFVVDTADMLAGEMRTLVVAGNACLPSLNSISFVQSFYLADVLPDVTVAEFLKVLRDDFGLVVVLTPRGTVRTVYCRDVLGSPDYVDLTHVATPAPEKTISTPKGVTLAYRADSEDVSAKDLGKGFEGQVVGDPVTLLSELPTTAPVTLDAFGRPKLPEPQIRLVVEKDAYYKSKARYFLGEPSTALDWEFFGLNYRPLDVNGGGTRQEQGHATTRMKRVDFDLVGRQTGLFPHMSQRGFQVGGEGTRSTAVRLLFYRGLQPLATPGQVYPMLDAHNRNLAGQQTGTLSLRLDGEAGTYKQFLREWLQVKLNPVVVKDLWALPPDVLAQFDFTRKVMVDGVQYLVRKISATAPVTKASKVDLSRV
ncbi:hypothetical protein LJY25_08245 [Hymenobacter sp. BT175]|uniref:hypothetical protein n=1 Tax=Hymenobacter translucens TaxID=2886507 RepID=UPI001D0EA341|nr:hypothetical protein [Hymenobacter translucens]MCC2546432.1 hypothetical protein [Hymenobacter translucens]